MEKVKELIYATKNPAKLDLMRKILSPLGLAIISLPVGLAVPVEGEAEPLLNARKKAVEYFDVIKKPIFSCDSALFFDGFSADNQPAAGIKRTTQGTAETLDDEKIIQYYSSLAKKHGRLTARYKNAICLILSKDEIYESDDEPLWGESFYIVEAPHKTRIKGFPLDSLSVEIGSNKYYLDTQKEAGESIKKGFQNFFVKALNIMI